MASSKQIRVTGIRRQAIDADKLAFAYVLLAKSILAVKDELSSTEVVAEPDSGDTDD